MKIEEIKEFLCKAIYNQKTITFEYKKEGDPVGLRVGNPHAVFSNKTTNNLTVDIYQIGGISKTNHEIPGWRPFLLEYIDNLKITDNAFDIAEGYLSNPESGKYDKVFCKIN